MQKKPVSSALIKKGTLAIFALACVLSFMFSQLELVHVTSNRMTTRSDNTRLPSASSLAAMFLNYRTFAADLGWIQMVVDYGDQLSVGRKNVNILHNGFVITGLDPTFRHVYDWVPGAFFANDIDPSLAQMKELSRLLERGQKAFPADGKISFDNAVNYMGNSENPTDSRKIAESDLAIKYLKEAMKRPNTPERASLLLEWFENRRAKLINKYENKPFLVPWATWNQRYVKKLDRKPNIEQLARFLLTSNDPEVTAAIRNQLAANSDDSSKKLIERVDELSRTFEETYNDDWRSFTPMALWTTLYLQH